MSILKVDFHKQSGCVSAKRLENIDKIDRTPKNSLENEKEGEILDKYGLYPCQLQTHSFRTLLLPPSI